MPRSIIILALCLMPIFAQAEMVCLDAPSSYANKKCNYIDPNAEIFRSTRQQNIESKPIMQNKAAYVKVQPQKRIVDTFKPSTTNRQQVVITRTNINNRDNRNYQAEQAIRKRAQLMESHFYKQQQYAKRSSN